MLGCVYKNMRFTLSLRTSPFRELWFPRNPHSSFSLSFLSTKVDANQHWFTVSYLTKSCGLSQESAIRVSKLVNFETRQKPDSVISLLEDSGFSQTQIRNVIKRFPPVLVSRPQLTILPKIEFFRSKELSSSDIAQILCACPALLHKSLKNHIIPSYDFLKDLLRSDEKTVAAIRRCPYILYNDPKTLLTPKMKYLLENGMPESSVAVLLHYWPQTFVMSLDKIRLILEKGREMGLNLSQRHFVFAFSAFKSMSNSTWEKKLDVLKGWNLSEEEIFMAFRKYPFIMTRSENKIMAIMDFLVNDLGWESSYIVKNPALIGYSLEKKLIPRASVLRFLMLNGLVKKDFRSFNFFACGESKFLQKFVNSHVEAPELLKLYGEKLALSR